MPIKILTALIRKLSTGNTFCFVGTFTGPIVLHVRTDEQLKGKGLSGPAINSQQALDIANEGIENGFKLTYSFTNSCPDFI